MKKETQEVINKCLKFNGGRSRPDKSFPFIKVIFDRFTNCGLKILDIGCGRGSFGYILNTEYDKNFIIDGLEIYSEYVDSKTKEQYRDIIFSDYTKTYQTLLNYNIYLMVDVVEHFKRDEAIHIIDFLTRNEKIVIASIPNAPKHWHQNESFEKGNIYEKHLFNWTNELVKQDLKLNLVGDFDAIGVYTNAE